MKAVLAFLAVNALLILANVLAAGTLLALGRWLKDTPLHDEYWAWATVAIAAVAVGIASSIWMAKLISRPRG